MDNITKSANYNRSAAIAVARLLQINQDKVAFHVLRLRKLEIGHLAESDTTKEPLSTADEHKTQSKLQEASN